MRWISLIGLVACAELPPLPLVDDGPDWTCADGFPEAVADCTLNDCLGFMAMDSVVDDVDIHYLTDRVKAVVKYGDADSIETVELHSITDHFRSNVTIGSVGLEPQATSRAYRVLERDFADTEPDAVTLIWQVSNSDIPQTKVGVRGLARVEVVDDWVRVTFLVNDQNDRSVQGCAYMPVD